MVSIRTHFPSVPQKWPEPLESQAEFAVGSNRRLWRVGFIWWGLREIHGNPKWGTPVFQSWWGMMIYGVSSSWWIEKRQLETGFVSRVLGESTLESKTSHGDVYIGKFFGHLWTVSKSPATLGIPGGITPWKPGPSGCGFSLKVLGKTSSSLAASLTSWTLGCSHCVVDICAEFIRVSDCFWGYERCLNSLKVEMKRTFKHKMQNLVSTIISLVFGDCLYHPYHIGDDLQSESWLRIRKLEAQGPSNS